MQLRYHELDDEYQLKKEYVNLIDKSSKNSANQTEKLVCRWVRDENNKLCCRW